jgi:hypothetical protein
MTATATAGGRRAGARVELARYTVGGVTRALVGQRVNGVVRLMDIPVEPGGRAHIVERGLEEEGAHANAALWALIEDYLQQARQFDAIPMEVSILD